MHGALRVNLGSCNIMVNPVKHINNHVQGIVCTCVDQKLVYFDVYHDMLNGVIRFNQVYI